MKNLVFVFTVLLLNIVGCSSQYPVLEKEELIGKNGEKLLFGFAENLVSLNQVQPLYNTEEIKNIFIVEISSTNLSDLGNAFVTWPVKEIILGENKLAGKINFPGIVNLETLHIGNESIAFLNFTSKMPNLKRLEIVYNKTPIDFPNIQMCPMLELLDMSNASLNNIPDGPPVPTLQKMRIEGPFDSMKNVSRFPNLIWLNINKSTIKKIEGLEKLNKLTHVNFMGSSELVDISQLINAPLLKEIVLEQVPFQESFVTVFNAFPDLFAINLNESGIENLAFLKDLRAPIKNISLMRNKIRKVENLELHPDVHWNYFIMMGNPIEEITRASYATILSREGNGESETNSTSFLYFIKKGTIKVVDK